ncbi:DUF3939 domain-containing protein [Mesobacillus sp. LC4]
MQAEKERGNNRSLFSESILLRSAAAIIWPIIGYLLDLKLDLLPYLTVVGSVGGVALYVFFAASKRKLPEAAKKTWPTIETSVDEIKKAVRIYSEQLPKGVYRTILVKEDNRIDAEQLAPNPEGNSITKFLHVQGNIRYFH